MEYDKSKKNKIKNGNGTERERSSYLKYFPQLVEKRAAGWTVRVRLPAIQEFSLLHSVQTGSGANPRSYPNGTGGDFPWGLSDRGVKLTTHLHLVPRSRMVKHPYVFMALCLFN
jgi:hypothetical protein